MTLEKGKVSEGEVHSKAARTEHNTQNFQRNLMTRLNEKERYVKDNAKHSGNVPLKRHVFS